MTGLILSLMTVVYTTCPITLDYIGSYDIDTKEIMVCQNYEVDNRVLFHEVWHRIRYNRMTLDQQNKYKIMRSKYKLPSKYARTDVEEWFAEDVRVELQWIKQKNNPKVSFVRKMTLFLKK